MSEKQSKQTVVRHTKQGGNAVYVLGMVGSAIYFVQNSDTLWLGFLGLIKALVWPAFIAYKLLESFYG